MIAIQPRKTILKLEYNDTDISGDISGDVESFTYNDRGADSSDSISIKVNAVDDKWINSWLPDKEAVLHPTLCTKNWIVQGDSTPLDCGTLVVDDLSYSAGPCVLTIGAVARPNGTSFHEKNQEYVWKKTSIKRIAQTIADRYGLGCSMDAEDVDIALKEQDDTDSSFLQKLCSTYGLILKTYRNKIWIFDREEYKKKDAVATFTPADIVPNSLSWNTTLSGTYTGGEFTYSNQKKKVNIKVTIGTADRMLKLNQYASSEADAKKAASSGHRQQEPFGHDHFFFDDGKPESVFDHVHQYKGTRETEREVLHGHREPHTEQIFRSGDESFCKQSGRVTA